MRRIKNPEDYAPADKVASALRAVADSIDSADGDSFIRADVRVTFSSRAAIDEARAQKGLKPYAEVLE